jgi:hypothetical protein
MRLLQAPASVPRVTRAKHEEADMRTREKQIAQECLGAEEEAMDRALWGPGVLVVIAVEYDIAVVSYDLVSRPVAPATY